MTIEWHNITVRLSDLVPWSKNPRMSSKSQARRLLESWRQFGQVQTVAVGPSLEVYDGHQRLSALLTVYGAQHEVDARQASRALTDEERRALVLALHNATGSWDWDALAGWDVGELQVWGFDEDTLSAWENDAAALRSFLESEANEKELTEQTELIRPRQMLRVLISFPIDVAADVRDSINSIIGTYGGEALFSAN